MSEALLRLSTAAGEVGDAAARVSREEIPDALAALGKLEGVRAALWARLAIVEPAVGIEAAGPDGDRLLDVNQAAEKLGVKKSWVYGHVGELPRVQLPGRQVRFSEKRLERFLAKRVNQP